MKKMIPHFKVLLLVLVAFILNACDNLTEEIHLNADGSGAYKMYTDMIPAMKQSANMMSAMFTDSTATEDSEEMAEMMRGMEDKLWADMGSEAIDSLIPFSEQIDEMELPEEILDDKRKMRVINNSSMFYKGSKAEGVLYSGLHINFEELEDINVFMDFMDEAQKNGSEAIPNGGPMGGMDKLKMNTKYKFDGNNFSRSTKYLNKQDISGEDLMFMNMMFPNSTVKTIVYLPENVKKVKGSSLTEKEGKTVKFEYSLLDMMTGKADTDFEIKMK